VATLCLCRRTGDREIVFDALHNSLINVLTIVGLVLGYLIGGAVLVEKVYAWPGLGRVRPQHVLRQASLLLAFILALALAGLSCRRAR